MPELEWIKRAYKRSRDASGASSAAAAAILEGRRDERLTVMIVDDNIHIIEALRDVLRGKYAVIACSSAEEVEQRFNDDVRLVLLDIKMAPADGFTIFSLLRQRSERVPIVIHTAYPGDSEAVTRLRAMSPAGFLMKGDYSLQHLDETVERAIGRSPGPPGGGGDNNGDEGNPMQRQAGSSSASAAGAPSRTRGSRRGSARSSRMTRATWGLRARPTTTPMNSFVSL